MAKRKTRHQKKLADLRHSTIQPKPLTKSSNTLQTAEEKAEKFAYTFTQSASANSAKQNNSSSSKIQINTYAYVMHDLQKTAMLSSAIILVQLILFFLLRIHIVKIPGIQY